jgi:hypothetical protein
MAAQTLAGEWNPTDPDFNVQSIEPQTQALLTAINVP